MPRTLTPSDGSVRIVSTTTTTKLAERMLAAAQVVAEALPHGFNAPLPTNILLALFVAEEAAHYPSEAELGGPPATTERWVIALAQAGLIERRDGLLALSKLGYEMVQTMLERLFEAQRRLD
ncbi:hypothetical protein [Sphingomonas sp. 2SG]|uniref:hypothetical protein n=1 Tax=Sphingomonas sp. 2SG TaxID=2502201 RepID=UPI0010F733F4|nr:hypothetical protein [Sphingomonas sp. 2SG]